MAEATGLADAAAGDEAIRKRVNLIVLSLLAAVGASLLAVIVGIYWMEAGDNIAYWIAGHRLATGLPIYASPDVAFEPFAYHYPPPIAQLLAPITLVLPAVGFAAIYRGLMLLALWHLAGRRMLQMLALLAFIPITVSLRVENVEIFMAIAIVLGLRRWPWLFTILALIKVSPGLGIVYLALRRRWRDVAVAVLLGGAIVGVSYLLAPDLWRASIDAIAGRGAMVGNSLVPLPYSVRLLVGLIVAVAGGLLGRRTGELLLVLAMTIANPGLSLQGFAVLAAAIPIWRAGPEGLGSAWERPGAAQSTPIWRRWTRSQVPIPPEGRGDPQVIAR